MQILFTKLSIPLLRSRLVARSRLIHELNQGLDCGFVLISAPAGYGKSTLLSAWLSQVDIPSCWLSIDDGDNHPVRFLTYLAAALRQTAPAVGEALGESLQFSPLPDVDVLLTPVVNGLAQLDRPFCLVLDDYHLIQNQLVHQMVSFLLEHRPSALLLVIATRADPPLPLARLRARSAMLELRQTDLCFTVLEAAEFLNLTMGLQVSLDDVARITARTEGWIAGLQMAALSMQNTQDISGFISTLSGSHPYIFDYLLEEILARQSPEIRRFLLNTSILDQLTAPLCDALLKEDAGASSVRPSSVILEELDHANLFIIALDQERRWYRYHSLFADLLRGYHRQNEPEQAPILHARASAWFEEQGWIADAIRHALAAGEGERVLRLISANVFALLEQSELPSVARQLDSLAGETSRARPWLWIGRAWLAAYTGQVSAVEGFLKLVEAEPSSSENDRERQTLTGHVAAIRAFATWINGGRETAARAAREALACLPASDYLLRCQSATLLGLSANDLDARSQAYEQALDYARELGVSHVTIFAYGCNAYLLYLQGKLRETFAACHEAIQLAQSSSAPQPLPAISYLYTTLSLVLCEWNDLEKGLFYAREAVVLARRWQQADALHFAYTNLGSALFASGDVEGAFEVLRQAWQVAHRTSAWFEEISTGQEMEWHLALDNLEAALQCLRLAQVDIGVITPTLLYSDLALPSAQVFLAQKQYTRALAVIDAIIASLEKRQIITLLVSALAWRALACHRLGQDAQALASLRRALTLAAPQGYVRSLLVAGGALIPLLHKARAAGIVPDYVDKLLASIMPAGQPPPDRAGKAPGLVESLSEREIDVLKLLAQGCSDKEIAGALVIARETVHKHLKNIYGKLDVHNRTEATHRARVLGLL